ncbi:lysophospholipid acyltransferase family protein [Macrococcoides canis]|uniref:1-acyl-sn-glycerol-3-phosphate acyltransferase n=1 Tax=Macrococcoides canis TaxID=1855823 RepID=A0AAE6X1Z5_9STAP|nr:lysophospholipid acyltransferase family protein [Macrococcus canis]QCT74857.1 1-acyl-sn-glycerol-3-phosphate acyltransferase [Macrococcus canis]QIH78459.1 1-acylglycerol-3-phosphate O-acyltransferase [Macrococcus canis]QNR07963.1 1-acylglycerol-3-phosphate O-acyltransferase [Macrococcus canis]QTQ07098.1 1-acyl-sn-glycerol-3-phosphate acyltransferase [Macrococcus canis]UTH01344.1 1-acyl-sn-glycerol-3-phosphate acyltransferase [Macrococcus canis]
MIRMIKTVSVIIGYAAFITPQFNRIEQKLLEQDDVYKRDKLAFIEPKKWAHAILKTAGVTVQVNQQQPLPEKSVLFVSNHEGNFDIPVLIHAIDKPFGFVSKVEVKKIPFLDRWMTLMNCIYLDRTDRRSSLQMIKDGIASLKAGHSVLIFPEGTRSKGNGIGEFKAGSLKLAKSAQVPIIPVAIKGTSNIMEKYQSKKMVPGTVQVTILPEISPDIFNDHSLQEAADYIRSLIATEINKEG